MPDKNVGAVVRRAELVTFTNALQTEVTKPVVVNLHVDAAGSAVDAIVRVLTAISAQTKLTLDLMQGTVIPKLEALGVQSGELQALHDKLKASADALQGAIAANQPPQ